VPRGVRTIASLHVTGEGTAVPPGRVYRRLRATGADIIDVGCEPGDPWPGVGDCVKRLRDDGCRVSIDSFHPQEVVWAVREGAELVLSVNAEATNNAKVMVGRTIGDPTFEEFFATDLFSEVREHIGQPQSTYRVATIAMHPSVAQYNGFYTVDSYQNNYRLSYKLRFRKVIARELEKNEEIRKYFDEWGSRCYVFVAQLGRGGIYNKKYADDYSSQRLTSIELDTAALKELGAGYVLSSVAIDRPERTGLRLERLFQDSRSTWDVYLYQVM